MENDNSDENLLGYKVTLEEVRFSLQEVYMGIDEIKKTFRSIFSAASLIVALIGALQVFTANVEEEYICLYWILVIISLALYVLLIIGCVYMIAPVKVKGPTPDDWDTLKRIYINREEAVKVYEQLIKNYLMAIEKTEPIVEKRYKWGTYLPFLLPIIVVLLFLIGFLPRVSVPLSPP